MLACPVGSRIGDPTSSTPGAVPRPRPWIEQSSAMHALYELKALRSPRRCKCTAILRRGRARGAADPASARALTRPRSLHGAGGSIKTCRRAQVPLAAQVLHHAGDFHFTELKDGLAAEPAPSGTPSSPCRSARSCSRRSTRASHSTTSVVAAGYSRVTMERLAHLLGRWRV